MIAQRGPCSRRARAAGMRLAAGMAHGNLAFEGALVIAPAASGSSRTRAPAVVHDVAGLRAPIGCEGAR